MTMDRIQNVDPFPPKVYKAHFDGDLSDAIKRIHANSVMVPTDRGVMKGGGRTNAGMDDLPHQWPEMQTFMGWLKPHIIEVWKAWELTQPIDLKVWKSWYNRTNSNAYVEEHDHGGSHIAVSFYMQKPEGSGNIEFRNTEQPMWVNYPRNIIKGKANDFWCEVPAETGDCLIFPGWLSHRVQPNPLQDYRIVFSCNIHGVSEYSPVLI